MAPSAPSNAPTSPTLAPSSPTEAPSAPSNAPTSPTLAPSSPTQSPTQAPTKTPTTASPTCPCCPTKAPTMMTPTTKAPGLAHIDDDISHNLARRRRRRRLEALVRAPVSRDAGESFYELQELARELEQPANSSASHLLKVAERPEWNVMRAKRRRLLGVTLPLAPQQPLTPAPQQPLTLAPTCCTLCAPEQPSDPEAVPTAPSGPLARRRLEACPNCACAPTRAPSQAPTTAQPSTAPSLSPTPGPTLVLGNLATELALPAISEYGGEGEVLRVNPYSLVDATGAKVLAVGQVRRSELLSAPPSSGRSPVGAPLAPDGTASCRLPRRSANACSPRPTGRPFALRGRTDDIVSVSLANRFAPHRLPRVLPTSTGVLHRAQEARVVCSVDDDDVAELLLPHVFSISDQGSTTPPNVESVRARGVPDNTQQALRATTVRCSINVVGGVPRPTQEYTIPVEVMGQFQPSFRALCPLLNGTDPMSDETELTCAADVETNGGMDLVILGGDCAHCPQPPFDETTCVSAHCHAAIIAIRRGRVVEARRLTFRRSSLPSRPPRPPRLMPLFSSFLCLALPRSLSSAPQVCHHRQPACPNNPGEDVQRRPSHYHVAIDECPPRGKRSRRGAAAAPPRGGGRKRNARHERRRRRRIRLLPAHDHNSWAHKCPGRAWRYARRERRCGRSHRGMRCERTLPSRRQCRPPLLPEVHWISEPGGLPHSLDQAGARSHVCVRLAAELPTVSPRMQVPGRRALPRFGPRVRRCASARPRAA